jgi:hypothetical protein
MVKTRKSGKKPKNEGKIESKAKGKSNGSQAAVLPPVKKNVRTANPNVKSGKTEA